MPQILGTIKGLRGSKSVFLMIFICAMQVANDVSIQSSVVPLNHASSQHICRKSMMCGRSGTSGALTSGAYARDGIMTLIFSSTPDDPFTFDSSMEPLHIAGVSFNKFRLKL